MRVTDEMVEMLAKWLHDEVEWPEYNYPERSWPEHEGDTGQRGDGWLKIVPPDVCEQFRDIARRLLIEAALAVEGTPKVKALEWREARISNERGRYTAVSVFGDYEALEWSNGGFGGTMPANATDEEAAVTEFDAASMDEAKAAAQADYEKRVLSCLEYTAPPAGIREALEVIESFIAETVDYATRNNLGDPEKQHNVKWGRKVLAALRGQS